MSHRAGVGVVGAWAIVGVCTVGAWLVARAFEGRWPAMAAVLVYLASVLWALAITLRVLERRNRGS